MQHTPKTEDTTTPSANVVFFHLPKAAGTTVTKYFYEHYGAARSFLSTPEKARQFDASTITGRYFSAHLNYNEYAELKSPHKSVVFFREPKARLLSTYYFLRAYNLQEGQVANNALLNAKAMDLAGWLRTTIDNPENGDLRELDNFYARVLLGRRYSDAKPRIQWDERTTEYYVARDRIRQFNAIGLVEHFNESLRMIAVATKLPEPTDEHLQATNTFAEAVTGQDITREPITAEIDHLLAQLTVTDQKLYDYAAGISREQCIVYG